MGENNLFQQIQNLRDNYTETLKKLISIEEEIEKTVFYLKSLEEKERQKVFSVYENYLKSLNILRDDLTKLMKDNLFTLKTLLSNINTENNKTNAKVLSNIYQKFLDFVFNCYTPFYWFQSSSKEEKK